MMRAIRAMAPSFMLIALLCLSLLSSTRAACHAGDREALLQIQSSGFKFHAVPPWNATTIKQDCCSWEGIACTSSGRVKSLELPNVGLYNADIPSRPLCRLTALERLKLRSFGSITGTIPRCIGTSLLRLQVLDLSDNRLVGRIPVQLGSLAHLQQLDLSNNNLGGGIPSQLCGLKNLKYLDLSRLVTPSSHPQGPVPDCLGGLAQLEKLGLSKLFLTGSIPSSLGQLDKLQELRLDGNAFVSGIPQSLGGLAKLKIFYLDGQGITGNLPTSFKDLVSMEDFYFENMARLGGQLPDFSRWSKVNRLRLGNTSASGGLATSLGRKKLLNLEELNLDQNAFSGQIPESLIAAVPNMKRFYLSSNNLNGTIPSSLGGLSKLEILYLRNNRLSGPIPQSLADLIARNRVLVDMSNNQLSGCIPRSLLAQPPAVLAQNPRLRRCK